MSRGLEKIERKIIVVYKWKKIRKSFNNIW